MSGPAPENALAQDFQASFPSTSGSSPEVWAQALPQNIRIAPARSRTATSGIRIHRDYPYPAGAAVDLARDQCGLHPERELAKRSEQGEKRAPGQNAPQVSSHFPPPFIRRAARGNLAGPPNSPRFSVVGLCRVGARVPRRNFWRFSKDENLTTSGRRFRLQAERPSKIPPGTGDFQRMNTSPRQA